MQPVPPHNKRVLIVEDEETIGAVVSETLTYEGYEVRWAHNGRDALIVLQDWLPHLIVLDLMMPVMNAWHFRIAQRRLGARVAAVPVIVLSGAREVRARGAELDAVEVLSKPFELDQLVEAVDRCTATASV